MRSRSTAQHIHSGTQHIHSAYTGQQPFLLRSQDESLISVRHRPAELYAALLCCRAGPTKAQPSTWAVADIPSVKSKSAKPLVPMSTLSHT